MTPDPKPTTCPTCEGTDPYLHPMAGGEVQPCRDPSNWHEPRLWPSGELLAEHVHKWGEPVVGVDPADPIVVVHTMTCSRCKGVTSWTIEIGPGAEMIHAERIRQVVEERRDARQDDLQTAGELGRAAAAYAVPEAGRNYYRTRLGRMIPSFWPWPDAFWKPTPEDRIRELVKAGALCAAEIDRLTREASR